MNALEFWSDDMNHCRLTICSLLLALAWGSTSLAQGGAGDVPPPSSMFEAFDQYGNISWEDEQARLDNFAISLGMTPNWIADIIVYAGRRACTGEGQRRAMRMKEYLVKHRGVDWGRVMWRDAGHLENTYVQLALMPRGLLAPLPVPLSRTLTAKQIRIINCKSKKQRRRER
ncbi:MAG TPA: hypothetical protein VIQ24_22990 [Pyrinomonadaceae bacterium]